MSWLGLTLTLGLTAGTSLAGGWWFVRCQRQARFMLDTPTSKIRSAAQGYVELYGILQKYHAPLVAPLTGLPCVWWSYRIEERESSGGRKSHWRTIEQKTSNAPLLLDDNTGQCLIAPAGAKVMAVRRQVWHGDSCYPLADTPVHRFSGLILGQSRYRYTEERLLEGDFLYAIGQFYTLGGAHYEVDEETLRAQIIRQWKQDLPDLHNRFDSNGDGQLDEAEWENTRHAALLEARKQIQELRNAPAQHHMCQPGENQPFILSNHGEDELSRRLYWKSIGCALLCLAGALATACILNKL
ncbi:MAG: GIDE domain-containing protein [Trichlorobacter sp.]|nr:GIDE domain-containing protein [Trichlorobacter sp.]